MTSTYVSAGGSSVGETAIDRAAEAIVARIEQMLATHASRDVAGTKSAAPVTQPDDWMEQLAAVLMHAVAQAAPAIADDVAKRNKGLFDFLPPIDILCTVGGGVVGALPGLGGLFRGVKDLPRDDAELHARFLPALLGIALPLLAGAVPDLIDAVTKQHRDTALELTPSDVTTRWVLPVLEQTIPHLINALPDIVSIFTQD